jgi:metal-responsive CopG/Arc/MetJ family transcriptional regulator
MKKKTKHLSIRLTSQQYQKLIDVLKTERVTKSELVRLALADYLENHHEKRSIIEAGFKISPP